MTGVPETKANQIVTDTIGVRINGEARRVPAGMTIVTLLQHLGIAADRVAIELDREIVRKPAWASTVVREGAELEIVQFVGGG